MTIDLNICGGFALNVDNMDDNAVYGLVQKIEAEANAALSKIARNYNLGFPGVELQTEE